MDDKPQQFQLTKHFFLKASEGLKFTIPTNSSLCNTIMTITEIKNGDCHIRWVDQYRTNWSMITKERFADKMLEKGCWVVITR